MTFCSRAVSTAHRTIEQFLPSPTRLPGLRSNHPTARAGRQTIGAPLTDLDGGLYAQAERQSKCRTVLVAQAALSGFEHRIRTPGAAFLGGVAGEIRGSERSRERRLCGDEPEAANVAEGSMAASEQPQPTVG